MLDSRSGKGNKYTAGLRSGSDLRSSCIVRTRTMSSSHYITQQVDGQLQGDTYIYIKSCFFFAGTCLISTLYMSLIHVCHQYNMCRCIRATICMISFILYHAYNSPNCMHFSSEKKSSVSLLYLCCIAAPQRTMQRTQVQIDPSESKKKRREGLIPKPSIFIVSHTRFTICDDPLSKYTISQCVPTKISTLFTGMAVCIKLLISLWYT